MIQDYISQKSIVQGVHTVQELELLLAQKKPLNIMMGQTFDQGQPVDMLKYSFFIMNLSDRINNSASSGKSTWLLADHFITDINQDKSTTDIDADLKSRIEYLEKINRVYGANIQLVKSSDICATKNYQDNLHKLYTEAKSNPSFKELVLQAVPADRRHNTDAMRYPFEELATIQTLDVNIKVGPPYEILYDIPARDIAEKIQFNKYVAIQLTKSLPLGNPDLTDKVAQEIVTYGILPYKKDSKGLGAYRIDAVNDTMDSITALINSTTDKRAIVDLYILTQQAKMRLTGIRNDDSTLITDDIYTTLLYTSDDILKKITIAAYSAHIHEPMHK